MGIWQTYIARTELNVFGNKQISLPQAILKVDRQVKSEIACKYFFLQAVLKFYRPKKKQQTLKY